MACTSCAICGSDLHLFHNLIPAMLPGDIMGHETMGEVVEVGKAAKGKLHAAASRRAPHMPESARRCASESSSSRSASASEAPSRGETTERRSDPGDVSDALPAMLERNPSLWAEGESDLTRPLIHPVYTNHRHPKMPIADQWHVLHHNF